MSDVGCKFIYGCVLLGETGGSAEDAELLWKCFSGGRLQTRLQRRKFGKDGNLKSRRRTDGKKKQQKTALRFNGPRKRRDGDKAGKQQTSSAMRRHCVKNTNWRGEPMTKQGQQVESTTF